MAITLDLKPEVKDQLEARAKESSLSLRSYLEKRLEEMFSVPEPRPARTPEERLRLWREFLNSHADIKAPLLSDDAISRESIYREREDKQL